jgi:hypothetical protein
LKEMPHPGTAVDSPARPPDFDNNRSKCEVFVVCLGPSGLLGMACWTQSEQKKPSGVRGKTPLGAREVELLLVDLYIAGTGVHIEQHTPAPNLTLHTVMRYRSLGCNGMTGAQLSR